MNILTNIPRCLSRAACTAALLLTGSGALQAQTVHWGNALADTLIQSDGTAITAADGFNFQIGIFEDGFTPGAGNITDWVTNWRPLDAAAFNETLSYFTSTFNITVDPLSGQNGDPVLGISDSAEAYSGVRVQAGQQLWLMVYNNTALDPTTELFLGSAGTWTLPTIENNQTVMPENFRLSEVSSTPLFGGANDLRGSGQFTDEPGGTYALQTATFVPEPGSATTLLLSAAFLLRRRRNIGSEGC